MQDFAKLFHIDGVGQLLATLEEPQSDDGCEEGACVILLRIADSADAEFRLGLLYQTEEAARAIFDRMTAETALIMAKPLISARASLMAQA
jgi:hypothetical protein